MAADLLEQIERGAPDSDANVADALRKCIALGGRAGSRSLTEWAKRELRGYGHDDDVPVYRKIRAPILMDGISGHSLFRRMQVAPMDLPEFVREAAIGEELMLRHGIREIEISGKRGMAADEAVDFGLPMNADLASYITHEAGDPYSRVDRIYWSVSPTVLLGVVDQVRTTLVELVAESRSGTGDPGHPSASAVTNAVNVAVYGGRSRVNVTAAQGTDGGGVVSTAGHPSGHLRDRPRALRSAVAASHRRDTSRLRQASGAPGQARAGPRPERDVGVRRTAEGPPPEWSATPGCTALRTGRPDGDRGRARRDHS